MPSRLWLFTLGLFILLGLVGCSRLGPVTGFETPLATSKDSPITITWAFWGEPAEVEINREVIRQFEQKHPEIRIEIRHEPYSNYFNTITPSLNSEDPPDVLFLFNIPAYAKDGVLENLEPYIERDGYNLDDYWAELLDTFRYDGDLYGLPRDNDTNVVYYNKTFFAEAGLEPPDEETSWDEFRAMLETLTKVEDGQTVRYGLAMEQGKWRHWLWQTGHGVLDSNTNPSKCLLSEADSIEAVSWFNDLIQDGLVLTGDALSDAGGDTGAFQSGQAAMIIQNASRIPAFNATLGLDYALAPLPVHEGWQRAGQTGGAGYVIAANSQRKEAAWVFLQWLQSPEGQMAFVGDSGALMPALRSVASSEEWQALPPEGRNALVLETESQAPPDGKFAEWDLLITQVIDPDMELIWAGRASPEQLLPVTCAEAEEFLQANNYPRP